MGETAEERARRLALEHTLEGLDIYHGCYSNSNGWSEDDTNDYERMLDEVHDKPTVNLVKKYSKGTFKFVNKMKKVEREEYDLIINFFQ